ncbi:RNA polymerase sigma factor [Hymenobacter lapidiphilus]|uniref:RNA polymerase sigma factor n=1 Tax=Hymenobacter lapidiphilus TaxID=2608003 RepID=A0A7Y7PMB3_9BACT|nr:RNA polymerase sigma factor [Hymenobacter lapidiphilus]NVO30277.1 RNA polymerase sigma factor [Hymenobacter lapidiphilus]
MLLSEQELVQRLVNREARAMTVFYQQFGRALHAAVWRVVRNQQCAEDVLQESLVKVWVSIGSYDPAQSRLLTWAATICRNAAIDYVRTGRHRAQLRTATLEDTSGWQFVAPPDFRPEHIGVRELLVGLRYEHRRVLDLLYLRGYTQLEAAEELQVPLGTVKTWSLGARHQLARLPL